MKTMLRSLISGILFLVLGFSAVLAVENSGTTIRRNADGCTIDIILQFSVEGTQADCDRLKQALNNTLGQLNMTIPCPKPKPQCCKVKFTIVVKLKDSIPSGDQGKYHQIHIGDDVSVSSVGAITVSGQSGTGDWRRNGSDNMFCHEVLHLMGLDDQYCARAWEVDSTHKAGHVVFERDCNPVQPDPNCCTPQHVNGARCGAMCPGYEGDIMSGLANNVSTTNISTILSSLGLMSCPDPPCCPTASVPVTTTGGGGGGGGGATTVNPNIVNAPDGTAITWSYTSFVGPLAPDRIIIELPPMSPVNFGIDGLGHPILSEVIMDGHSVTTSAAEWMPGPDTVKYTVIVMKEEAVIEVMDPYITKTPVIIPAVSGWGVIVIGIVLIIIGTLFILRWNRG